MDFGRKSEFKKLTEAMNEMVTDDSLYRYCKQNAAESKPFLLEVINNG
jgi:hypothetical protein